MAHRYSRNFIEKIRFETDLGNVASEFIVLKKVGGLSGDYVALCPFHQETIPSFRIVARKQIFCCYGCCVGGDVFDFVMRIKGLNFKESVRYLGKRSGLL